MNTTFKTSAITIAFWLLTTGEALARPCTIGAPGCAAPVPEPGSLPLFIVGGVAAAIIARYFKKK